MSTDTGNRSDDSEVFLVRLWAGGALPHQQSGGTEDREDREDRVQGKVTHLLSGKASSFSDGDTLVSLLVDMLPKGHDADNLEGEKGATP
ncbi:MAG TPA: hypothetical protein VF914_16925 [Chloroflexia bacterium]